MVFEDFSLFVTRVPSFLLNKYDIERVHSRMTESVNFLKLVTVHVAFRFEAFSFKVVALDLIFWPVVGLSALRRFCGSVLNLPFAILTCIVIVNGGNELNFV